MAAKKHEFVDRLNAIAVLGSDETQTAKVAVTRPTAAPSTVFRGEVRGAIGVRPQRRPPG